MGRKTKELESFSPPNPGKSASGRNGYYTNLLCRQKAKDDKKCEFCTEDHGNFLQGWLKVYFGIDKEDWMEDPTEYFRKNRPKPAKEEVQEDSKKKREPRKTVTPGRGRTRRNSSSGNDFDFDVQKTIMFVVTAFVALRFAGRAGKCCAPRR